MASVFTEHRVPTEQGNLYVRDHEGAGPTFVLMHGFPDNLLIYDALIPFLVQSGRRVVAFDFLGFGQSDKPAGAAYSFSQQQGDLEAVIAYLGLGTVTLVPHDSSGIVAINYALAHPGKVASLGILNSAYDDSPLNVWPEMITLFADPALAALAMAIAQSPAQFGWLLGWQGMKFQEPLPEALKPHFAQAIVPLIAANFTAQPGAGPAFVQLAAQFYAELHRNGAKLPQVAALEMPVKVIWGEFDPYLGVALGRERAARFRNGAFHPVQGGHWLQSDVPEQVAQALLS
jgi:haloalkane dehalogenase